MKTHAIVEIEEGALRVLVGREDGGRARVLRARHVAMSGTGVEQVRAALRALRGDVLQGVDGVHVVVGDRRSQHFATTLPQRAAKDAAGFVEREVLRLTNMQFASDVLSATEFVRRLPGRRVQLATSAMVRSAWGASSEAFEACGLEVVGLYTLESCLALACSREGGAPEAVLDCTAGRARYVLCVDGVPVQVRRFLVGGGETDAAALAMQLALELPRTHEWLREVGQPAPARVLIAPRLGFDDAALEVLAGDEVGAVESAPMELDLAEDVETPSLSAAMLLQRLVAGAPPASLLHARALRLPLGPGRVAAAVAAVAVGCLGASSAVVDGGAFLAARGHAAAATEEGVALAERLEELRRPPVVDEASSPQLEQALSLRRPISRLFVDVSARCGDMIRLEELRFGSKSELVVAGFVRSGDRGRVLDAVAAFVAALNELPYVASSGRDEVTSVSEGLDRSRFKVCFTWRNRD